MTGRKCHEIEALIDREAHGWADAERLRIEQHLQGCASCRDALAMARMVRSAIEAAPYELAGAARGRALARAFARTDGIAIQDGRKRRTMLAWSASGTAVALAAAAAFVLMTRSESSELASKTPAPRPAAVAANAPQAPLSPKVEDTTVEASEREHRMFAHAAVDLEPATRVRFDAKETTLSLERGRVDIDVDVSKGQPFQVVTQHFRVQVLGTRFSVTPETVTVERGHVQVFGLDGRVLARDLAAGGSYHYETPKADAHEVEHEAHEPTSEAHDALPARTYLARARAALSQANTKSAREWIDRAERADPTRADRAEAGTLRAEAALLDRDFKSAVRFYENVAHKFDALSAGENAAFAAAQLAARAEPARERTLLQRYLQRYPRGRFADEAKQRIQKLEAK